MGVGDGLSAACGGKVPHWRADADAAAACVAGCFQCQKCSPLAESERVKNLMIGVLDAQYDVC